MCREKKNGAPRLSPPAPSTVRAFQSPRNKQTFLKSEETGQSSTRAQCVIFTGIGPEAESNHVTLRIKYGKIPKKTGISPDPAAESKVGYIPPFWHATVASSPGARAPLAKHGRRPWPVRRLGAFAQRGRAHCAYWAMCSQLFGLFRAKRAILSLHAGWRWRAAQSENQLDTGRFAMKGMHSTRP